MALPSFVVEMKTDLFQSCIENRFIYYLSAALPEEPEIFIFIKIYLSYNVVLVSVYNKVIQLYIDMIFYILFYYFVIRY